MSSLVSAVSSFIYTELHDSYTTESVSYHAFNHTYETREKKAAETCAMTSHTITLTNCYFPSGKTSTQTSQRIKVIQKLTSYLQN